MFKNILRILGIFAVGMVGGIFATQVLWPYFVERPLFERYGLSQAPIYVTERKEVIIQENNALENAIEKVQNTVIGLRSKTQEGKIMEGSCLIVTSDGIIVTLAELIPQGSSPNFYVNKKAVAYQILKRDTKLNLALIKIEKNNLPTVGFADLGKIKIGERVFMVGNIFASTTPENTVNEGIIQNFNKDLIGTSITQAEGGEGSVLFDIEGNVVGLNKVNENGKIITIPASLIKTFTGF
jgi:serine protease Do